jgi:hypothetical protein
MIHQVVGSLKVVIALVQLICGAIVTGCVTWVCCCSNAASSIGTAGLLSAGNPAG